MKNPLHSQKLTQTNLESEVQALRSRLNRIIKAHVVEGLTPMVAAGEPEIPGIHREDFDRLLAKSRAWDRIDGILSELR